MRAEEFITENLRDWFKEKWVRFNPQGKIMGACARGSDKEGKPKCLPQSKAHSLGKKGRASAAAKKRREDPNPERRGQAKNVATKVREQGMAETFVRPETAREQQVQLLARTYAELYWGDRSITERARTARVIFNAVMSGELDIATLKMEIRALEQEHDISEEQDACYRKVKSRYKVWPSAYASGALVQCRKKGAANWGNKGKK